MTYLNLSRNEIIKPTNSCDVVTWELLREKNSSDGNTMHKVNPSYMGFDNKTGKIWVNTSLPIAYREIILKVDSPSSAYPRIVYLGITVNEVCIMKFK